MELNNYIVISYGEDIIVSSKLQELSDDKIVMRRGIFYQYNFMNK